jgi:hypothetical protein
MYVIPTVYQKIGKVGKQVQKVVEGRCVLGNVSDEQVLGD